MFDLHELAILVIIVIIMNVFNLAPTSLKAGAKSTQTFFIKNTLGVLMAAVGMSTDFKEIIKAFTPANATIALAVVAVHGAANRIDLISFVKISSRVSGAMMLIIASIIFGIFS